VLSTQGNSKCRSCLIAGLCVCMFTRTRAMHSERLTVP
jgi:hypothetical protein